MKIISYNVNGIRAAVSKGLYDWLEVESPDILCLQETKAQEEQIDLITMQSMGYQSYIHSAEKKGYSGVALFSKQPADNIEIGMGVPLYDQEGRVLRADFGDLTVVSVYIPSGTTGDIRQDFKMDFLVHFEAYVRRLREERKNVVISGDYNICHKPIDINNPQKHTKSSGFLPDERAWFDDFVASGMIDSFRVFDQRPDQYSWWSYRAGAKPKNLGWRIDYHMVSAPLKDKLLGASILPELKFSDHCPIIVELDF